MRSIFLLFSYIINKKGIFTNKDDSLEALKEIIENYFLESSVQIVGCVALFWAKK